jgi:hypothetical protein
LKAYSKLTMHVFSLHSILVDFQLTGVWIIYEAMSLTPFITKY